jgi:hypothetical protein
MELFRYGMFLAACLLISFVAQSVGLVVGAAMNVQNGKTYLLMSKLMIFIKMHALFRCLPCTSNVG